MEPHDHARARSTVREGHGIGHAVKAALLTGGRAVRDVLVHIEPAPEPQEAPAGREPVSG